ncbi:hypothetical protein SAGO17_0052 [Mimivirus AB-566-O17]|uniref:Uncharacterized protein n=1 Tax=Mimivirus AB-566-O17 TaxID=1988039 RepID=A0A1X9VNS0_9VIRU|nr:hypothetical protein SAGO17_0052 [Mimivirus AB-566-O17]
MKTTQYTNADIKQLAKMYCNPSDAYSDLGSELMKKFKTNKFTKIYNKHYSDENLLDIFSPDYITSDQAYDALDDLILSKTGVTVEKIEQAQDTLNQNYR